MTKFLSNGGLEVLWTRIKNYVGAKLSDGSVTKVGTATVGGTAQGIYLNAGTPTACTATVGKSTQPIYLSGGTAKAVSTFVVGTQTAATNAWTGSVPGLTAYYDGLTIDYYLPFAGTSSAATLNLNSLGACKVWNGRGRSSTTTHFPQYSIIRLTYYGGAFYASAYYDSNSVYLSAMCWTSAGTAAKTASASSFYPYAGVFMLLTMNTANTYSGKMTLNVNGRGAKDLWINGKVSSADNCTLPIGTYPCYYDGTVWHLYTDGRIRHKAVYADTIHLINADGTTSSVATADDIDGILTAAATLNGNAMWNDGENLAMGGIVEWAGTQTSTVTVKNTSATSVAGIYLYGGKLIAKSTDNLWYANWQEAGRWGDTAEGSGWEPSKNVVYRLTGSNTLWRWSGTAMERLLIAADSATALSSSAGSATQPVYFSGGKPVAVTMQTTMHALCNALGLGDSNPQDNDYYICQYAGGGTSNTTYFRRKTSSLYAYMKGKMDALYAAKSHTHSYLPLAGGTMTGTPVFSKGTRIHDNGASAGTSGYLHLCQIKITATYCNQPINIGICRRNDLQVTDLVIYFKPSNTTDPGIGSYTKTGVADVYIHKSDTSTWDVYVKKTEPYDTVSVLYYYATSYMKYITVTWGTTMLTELPEGYLTFTTRTVSGNATSATKLATARKISLTGAVTGNVSFDGSGDVTISTSSSHTHNYATGISVNGATYSISGNVITIPNYVPTSGGTFNGQVNIGMAQIGTIIDNGDNITIGAGGNGGEVRIVEDMGDDAGKWLIETNGNATFAKVTAPLAGNASTASKWATARTLTLSGSVTGSASIDGSGNVTLATTTNHTHSYLPLAGGTMTGAMKRYYSAASADPMISLTTNNQDIWLWRISSGSSAGVNTSASYGFGLKYIGTGSGNDNNLVLYADNQGGTQVAAMTVNQNGTTTFSGTVKATTFTGALSGNASTATKLATSRTINGTSFDGSGNITTAKWGTARAVKIGSTSKNVDGSAAVTWTLAEIGAAAASHNHDSSYAAKSHTHTIANITNLQSTLDAKLAKTTYEVNTELQMGSSGKVCLGKYTCGDTNITIEIRSTAADTYHGTLIIATQNITASGGGTYTAKVYGDEDGTLTPLIKIQRSGAVFSVYADLPTYSKNLIHAQCANPAAAPTDIATSVTSIPTEATIEADNALDTYAKASTVNTISNTVSGHTTQLSELNLRTVQHSDKAIVCTTATSPDSQGRLVGKTGFYAGQAVYMGVQAVYVFFASSATTGTLVIYGQGVGTKGGGTQANQIMYSRTAANSWTKLG